MAGKELKLVAFCYLYQKVPKAILEFTVPSQTQEEGAQASAFLTDEPLIESV